MVGVNRVISPNVAFARAGLLTLDAAGAVVPAATRAIYGPGNFVLINRTARQQGIVTPAEEPAVRRKVTEVLRALTDPETGRPVVADVLDPRTNTGDPRFGGPTGGDLYLLPAPGYLVGKGLRGEPVGPLRPRGDHFLDPRRPSMKAGFTIAGPGVASGVSLGSIRQIDVAPTLAALLGIEPPAQATGRVLEDALARKAPRPPVR
jgi:predicted AlkP superfamily phosphohydrolase/phosphomutase